MGACMTDKPDPDFVDELGKIIIDFMSMRGLPDADGMSLSQAAMNWVRETYEGDRIWIRKGRAQKKPHVEKIRAEFDGTNLAEIMRRYDVSRTTVYRIVRERK